MLKIIPNIWRTFESIYLTGRKCTVEQIYDSNYAHDETYAIAEAMLDFDEQFQKFRQHHILLIQRSIGMGAASLKGRSVDLLQVGGEKSLLPGAMGHPRCHDRPLGRKLRRVRDSISGPSTPAPAGNIGM